MESNADYITTEGIYRIPGGVYPNLWKDTFINVHKCWGGPLTSPIDADILSKDFLTISFNCHHPISRGNVQATENPRGGEPGAQNHSHLLFALSKVHTVHSQEIYHILYGSKQIWNISAELNDVRVFGRHLKLATTRLFSPTASPSSLGSIKIFCSKIFCKYIF